MVLKSGTTQSSPVSRSRLSTKPVVWRSAIPKSTFIVKQVWIAASLNVRDLPLLPEGLASQSIAGSNQIVSDLRRFHNHHSATLQCRREGNRSHQHKHASRGNYIIKSHS
jgi:hypothetical protein